MFEIMFTGWMEKYTYQISGQIKTIHKPEIRPFWDDSPY